MLSVSISGIDDLIAHLNGAVGEEIIREGVTESTALLLNRTRRNFLEQVNPFGEYWEPSFAAFRRSFTGRGGGTLFDTGTLFHSIQAHSVSPTEGAISTDVDYGVFHQYGTNKMPQRQFLGFSEEDASLALRVFIRKLEEAFQ